MRKSYVTLHTAVILAGFTGVFGKLISLNEGLLVWHRMLLATIILFLILKLSKTSTKMPLRDSASIARVGLLLTTHWLLFYASIKYSNISIGVVCYSLTSFYTAIFEPLINKKKFHPTELFLSAITLLGISLIFHFDQTYQTGILLGVISSAFAALYTIYNEKLVRVYNSRVINYYQMLGGSIGWSLLLPVYLFFFPVASLLPDGKDFFYLFLLAFFCTVCLYILFAEALKKIPAFTVNLSFNLEPIYSIVLAFLFFNEGKEVNASFYAGLALVMTSVVLQSYFAFRANKKQQVAS